MDPLKLIIKEILNNYLEKVGPQIILSRMEKAIPRIAQSMRAKGMVLGTVPAPVVVRDALFRLWRSVIPSGDMADFVRDRQAKTLVPKVVPLIQPGADMEAMLEVVAHAAIDQAFG